MTTDNGFVPSTGWLVKRMDGKYRVYYRKIHWPSEPRDTRADAQAYADRLSLRWDDDTAELLATPMEGQREKGGPWRWNEGNETGVINMSRLSDAKDTLRRKLGRKRLPKGITWELAR